MSTANGNVAGGSVILGSPALVRTLAALAAVNFFLADARDGLGPFLDAYLIEIGWSAFDLGFIATLGGVIGLVVTPIFGALVDGSTYKRLLVILPVVVVTAAAFAIIAFPQYWIVIVGHSLTAIIGAIIGPAVMGMTLGLVGEKRFPGQVSRNEFWNHSGNLVSLIGVYLATQFFGLPGVVSLMVVTAAGAVLATLAINPTEIDHDVARGLTKDEGNDQPSGLSVLLNSPTLIGLAIILLVFHFGNAPMSRLIAQEFSIQLHTPFRTTAVITGVAQLTMIGAALLAPIVIRKWGLRPIFLLGLIALPVRGLIAASFNDFWVILPVQFLDGIGAGLLGIATPVAVERVLSGTGRFNVGLAAVLTVQGIGAASSNIFAGWLVEISGYNLAYFVHGGVAAVALVLFFIIGRGLSEPGDALRRTRRAS